jgi:subtilase family serine protease
VGTVSGGKRISFEVDLALSDPTGAAAFAKAVSDPGSSSYEHYLTPAQWEAKYSPTSATVTRVEAFLRAAGFSLGAVSADRMTIDASGSATSIERTFGTTLSYHLVQGKKLILNNTDVSVPSSLGTSGVGVGGLTQVVAEPASISASRTLPASGV